MTWGEAVRLARVLAGDPSSHVATALADIDAPRSREWLLLADTFDLLHTANAKRRPPPYPRPGDKPRRHGDTAGRTPQEVLTILRAHGHNT